MSVIFHTFTRIYARDGLIMQYAEGTCNSADVKPTGAAAADLIGGSILVEEDTGDVYFYNKTADAWGKQFSFKE